MSNLALNLLLALTWMFLNGDFSLHGLLVGVSLGFLCIAFIQHVPRKDRHVRAVLGSIRLLASFLKELVLANLQLARDVLRPELPFHPQHLRLDVRDLGRTQTVLLANLISLTPGTITVDAEDDGSALYVHTLYAADPEAVQAQIRRLADLILRASGEPPRAPDLPRPPEERP